MLVKFKGGIQPYRFFNYYGHSYVLLESFWEFGSFRQSRNLPAYYGSVLFGLLDLSKASEQPLILLMQEIPPIVREIILYGEWEVSLNENFLQFSTGSPVIDWGKLAKLKGKK